MYKCINNHDVIYIFTCYQSCIKTPLWRRTRFVTMYDLKRKKYMYVSVLLLF